ncbi:hypothetical protein [Ruegeria arenilitoris]|uniref:hypothetical protein n=1 Tax=Ruegeria arenilitoris TaxID=1173585 RepID=UPI00147AC440|nr:hypothetical protein [Ruegeria arenilitoris]
MEQKKPHVLILGSAPTALMARGWPSHSFAHIVAINNAWRIRADWDFLIHPEDFPTDNLPDHVGPNQRVVTAEDYVPLQNELGGFVYAGGTMAFTAGYWALAALKPSVMAFLGCDMVYPRSGNTHFYGNGAADPLRPDITLRSLEAKSARLALFGATQNCSVVRLSDGESRLVFPTVSQNNLDSAPLPSFKGMTQALKQEAEMGYFVPSGRYWECQSRFDPVKIDELDNLWLKTYRNSIVAHVV